LFAILLGTLMIPGEMLLIPNYVTLTRLGWLDH
jgi:multiple sugar transport system permease protein